MTTEQVFEITQNLCNDTMGAPTYIDQYGHSYYTDSDGVADRITVSGSGDMPDFEKNYYLYYILLQLVHLHF